MSYKAALILIICYAIENTQLQREKNKTWFDYVCFITDICIVLMAIHGLLN